MPFGGFLLFRTFRHPMDAPRAPAQFDGPALGITDEWDDLDGAESSVVEWVQTGARVMRHSDTKEGWN